jgi:hypothetical protein
MNKPLSSDEQKAALGNIQRKPQFVDMFTGEASTKLPRRGNGSHVQLKPTGIEKPVIPGMASFAGEGPAGKRCENCQWFGRVKVVRPDMDTIEVSVDACLRAAQLTGRVHAARVQIRFESACRHFSEGDGPREWRIGPDGKTHTIVGRDPQAGDVLGDEVSRP